MSVDHKTTTTAQSERELAIAAARDLVESFEEVERREAREYQPSAWLEDMKAFDVAQHTLREAQKLVDPSAITRENLDQVINSLQARFDDESTTDEQKNELGAVLNVLYAAQGRVELLNEASADRYSYFAAEYFMRSQDMNISTNMGDNAAASDPAMLRRDFQAVLEQMSVDARVYSVLAQRYPRQS